MNPVRGWHLMRIVARMPLSVIVRVLYRRAKWRLGFIPPSGHPFISNEPLTLLLMHRAMQLSRERGWKDIVP